MSNYCTAYLKLIENKMDKKNHLKIFTFYYTDFRYTVHRLDIFVVYETTPLVALPLPWLSSCHYVTADRIPYAVLPIPVTVYQLLKKNSFRGSTRMLVNEN